MENQLLQEFRRTVPGEIAKKAMEGLGDLEVPGFISDLRIADELDLARISNA